jgi:alkanesulfonate monooxygenase SsuD/methylene tetrahydromethanopterin reductase-like flavin-dependent oxidoreductase (luciferase family)
VEAWNAWPDLYGNTPEGFAATSAKVTEVTEAAERLGRDPLEVERSACVFVVLDPAAERLIPGADDCPPLEGSPERIAEGLREMAEAGANEAILFVSPITERSIHDLGQTLAVLDS